MNNKILIELDRIEKKLNSIKLDFIAIKNIFDKILKEEQDGKENKD
jgi:hypothetical protein